MSRERERLDEIGKKIKRDQGDHVSSISTLQMGARRQVLLGQQGTLNTIRPCAACKLLRRRCAQECPFSPYFSPHDPFKFASVHKVFGASNVSKMLLEVPESQRVDAVNSLVYEANVRLRDPVYGCMGAISALQHQVQSLQAELNSVRAKTLKYKYMEANNLSSQPPPSLSSPHVPLLLNSSNELVSVATPPRTAQPLAPLAPPPPPPPPPLSILPPTSSSSSSSSSMYTQPTTNALHDFSTLPNDNVSFFG